MFSLHFHQCYYHQLYLYHPGFEADGTELHLMPAGRVLESKKSRTGFFIL